MHIIIFKKKNKYEFLKFFSIFVHEISNIFVSKLLTVIAIVKF